MWTQKRINSMPHAVSPPAESTLAEPSQSSVRAVTEGLQVFVASQSKAWPVTNRSNMARAWTGRY